LNCEVLDFQRIIHSHITQQKHKQIQRFIHAILAQKTAILWSEHTRTIAEEFNPPACVWIQRLYRSPNQPKLQCKKPKYAIRYLHGACTNLLVELWLVLFFWGRRKKSTTAEPRSFFGTKFRTVAKFVDLLPHAQSEIFKVKSEYFSPETQALC
jgi:hypothetical protein